MCWADTLVHPIEAEDNAIALIKLRERRHRPVRGELDVPRRHGPARRGGRHRGHDLAQPLPAHRLRDVHLRRRRRLRGREGRDRERLAVPRRRRGRRARLRRHVHRHVRRHRAGRAPRETFYDGYVVNAVMDACYRSAAAHAWAPVELDWRGGATPRIAKATRPRTATSVIKEEHLPDGRRKLILKDPATNEFVDRIV